MMDRHIRDQRFGHLQSESRESRRFLKIHVDASHLSNKAVLKNLFDRLRSPLESIVLAHHDFLAGFLSRDDDSPSVGYRVGQWFLNQAMHPRANPPPAIGA